MIAWALHSKSIAWCKPYFKNARRLSKAQHSQLSKSIEKFGVIDKLICNTNGTIIGGHQRYEILKSRGDKVVDVWMPERALDEKEVEELNIRLNKNNGSFDFDILANSFEQTDLESWGFDAEEFGFLLNDETEDAKGSDVEEKKLKKLSFTVTVEQAADIEHAISAEIEKGPFEETGNENTRGNSIWRICYSLES